MSGDTLDAGANGWEDDEAWSFDDDDLVENEKNDDDACQYQKLEPPPHKCQGSSSSQQPQPKPQVPPLPPLATAPESVSFLDDPVLNDVFEELKSYVTMLHDPKLLDQLNYDFENLSSTSTPASTSKLMPIPRGTETNQKTAQELLQYYTKRENLKSYTLETELPRMEYTVYQSRRFGREPLTEKNRIQQCYLEDDTYDVNGNDLGSWCEEIVWRASNQSILADAISVLTERSPPLVRSDLCISCVARRCRFVLHLEGTMSFVESYCDLVLHVPNMEQSQPQAPSSVFATVSLAIRFVPRSTSSTSNPRESLPAYSCRVVRLEPPSPRLMLEEEEELRTMALILRRDYLPPDWRGRTTITQSSHRTSSSSVLSLRDSLVSYNSSIRDTAVGMKSALGQVEKVMNIQSKWSFLKNVLPVLPTAELLQECEAEEENEMLERMAMTKKADLAQNEGDRDHDHFQLYRKGVDQDHHYDEKNVAQIRPNPPPLQLYRKDDDGKNIPDNRPPPPPFHLYRKEGDDKVAPKNPLLPPPPPPPLQLYRKDPNDKVVPKAHPPPPPPPPFQLYRRDDKNGGFNQSSDTSGTRPLSQYPPPPPSPTKRNTDTQTGNDTSPTKVEDDDDDGRDGWSDDELDLSGDELFIDGNAERERGGDNNHADDYDGNDDNKKGSWTAEENGIIDSTAGTVVMQPHPSHSVTVSAPVDLRLGLHPTLDAGSCMSSPQLAPTLAMGPPPSTNANAFASSSTTTTFPTVNADGIIATRKRWVRPIRNFVF